METSDVTFRLLSNKWFVLVFLIFALLLGWVFTSNSSYVSAVALNFEPLPNDFGDVVIRRMQTRFTDYVELLFGSLLLPFFWIGASFHLFVLCSSFKKGDLGMNLAERVMDGSSSFAGFACIGFAVALFLDPEAVIGGLKSILGYLKGGMFPPGFSQDYVILAVIWHIVTIVIRLMRWAAVFVYAVLPLLLVHGVCYGITWTLAHWMDAALVLNSLMPFVAILAGSVWVFAASVRCTWVVFLFVLLAITYFA